MGDVVVDIAMPVYRRTTYLADAVESVLAQTFDDWGLLIWDNGPGGGAIEAAIEPYLSDPRVSYRPTGAELPLAENWTRAINHGQAQYVALLHDDDRWHPDFLSVRVQALEAHPECGFAFGEFIQVDDAGVEVSRSSLRFAEGVVARERLANRFLRECVATPPTILVRRSAYQTVGARFNDEWLNCDWEMWARLAARFPAYYVARYDSDFRRHEGARSGAISNEGPERFVAMLDSLESTFRRELRGFDVSRSERARNRSLMLMDAARDAHLGGGWRASYRFYARSIREHPPTAIGPTSLRMLAHSLLGRRLSRLAGRALRAMHT